MNVESTNNEINVIVFGEVDENKDLLPGITRCNRKLVLMPSSSFLIEFRRFDPFRGEDDDDDSKSRGFPQI